MALTDQIKSIFHTFEWLASLQADERAGEVERPKQDVGALFVADRQPYPGRDPLGDRLGRRVQPHPGVVAPARGPDAAGDVGDQVVVDRVRPRLAVRSCMQRSSAILISNRFREAGPLAAVGQKARGGVYGSRSRSAGATSSPAASPPPRTWTDHPPRLGPAIGGRPRRSRPPATGTTRSHLHAHLPQDTTACDGRRGAGSDAEGAGRETGRCRCRPDPATIS
jgi:hypothetical protein